MLLFVGMDLFPGGEAFGEVPAFDSESNTVKDGNVGIFQTPESGGKRVWVAKWRRRGSHRRDDWSRSGYGNI